MSAEHDKIAVTGIEKFQGSFGAVVSGIQYRYIHMLSCLFAYIGHTGFTKIVWRENVIHALIGSGIPSRHPRLLPPGIMSNGMLSSIVHSIESMIKGYSKQNRHIISDNTANGLYDFYSKARPVSRLPPYSSVRLFQMGDKTGRSGNLHGRESPMASKPALLQIGQHWPNPSSSHESFSG